MSNFVATLPALGKELLATYVSVRGSTPSMLANGREPVEVRPCGDGWEVGRRGGAARAWYPTQPEADRAGREIARREHLEFVLLDRDGDARAISTYGTASRA
jgi:hypothetical protein